MKFSIDLLSRHLHQGTEKNKKKLGLAGVLSGKRTKNLANTSLRELPLDQSVQC
jgi:hypothetical protein